MFKSKVLFLSDKKVFLLKLLDLWQNYDPDFWLKKLQQVFRKQNVQILHQTFGKQGASVKADLLCSLFLSELRKKLKMATLTEAPFMVKSNFWNNKYFFLQIFAQ